MSIAVERLESRTLLSAIVWTNEGSATNDSDGFNAVFGADAGIARADVQQALTDWDRVIANFNYPSGPDQMNVTLFMSGDPGFGAEADFGANVNGVPTGGSISINVWDTTKPDNGYYLDPTPQDDGEFRGGIVNAYAANATPNGPAAGKADLYTVVALETAHELGLNNSLAELFTINPNGYVGYTGQRDQARFRGNQVAGYLFTFEGPDVQALFTSDNAGTQDLGTAIHTAEPAAGNTLVRNGVTYYGAQDSDNAIFELGRRYLPSYLDALVLKDTYGYSVNVPPRNMYVNFDSSTGNLLISGGQNGEAIYQTGVPSNDNITIASHTAGDTLFTDATVLIGNPIPGTGPNVPLTSSFPGVTSITINGQDGSDTINVQASPAPVTVYGTSQSGAVDSLNLSSGVGVTVSNVGAGTSMLIDVSGGNDNVTLDYSAGTIAGAINFTGVTLSPGDTLQIRGASASDPFTILASSITHGASVVNFTFTGTQTLALTDGTFTIGAALPAGTSLSVSGPATVLVGAAQNLSALSLSGGTLSLAPGGANTLTVASADISGGATLDLANNALLVNYGAAADPASALRMDLRSGFNQGAWNGPGIISSSADASHRLGLADSADGSFAGLAPQTLTIRLARTGNVNLDGTVNFSDVLIMIQHYGHANSNWDQGDLNYDGTVNFADVLALIQNYGGSGAAVASPLAAVTSASALSSTLAASSDTRLDTQGKSRGRRPGNIFDSIRHHLL